MDILLTGATGFAGRHLATALAREHRVICLNRRVTGAADEVIHDLAQPLPFDRLPRQIDIVVHAAGLVGQDANASPLCQRVNVDATTELIDYAVRANAKRFIFFSTGGVYGPTEQKLTEESVAAPADSYTRSKLAAEAAVQSVDGKLATQILRLFFPYGPGQYGRLVPRLIENVIRGTPIAIANTSGLPLVTPLFVDDLVEYVRRVLLIPDTFVANLAGNEVASIRVLSDMIGRALNRPTRFEVKEGAPVGNWWGDNARISLLTEYSPRVSLELGIKRTIASM